MRIISYLAHKRVESWASARLAAVECTIQQCIYAIRATTRHTMCSRDEYNFFSKSAAQHTARLKGMRMWKSKKHSRYTLKYVLIPFLGQSFSLPLSPLPWLMWKLTMFITCVYHTRKYLCASTIQLLLFDHRRRVFSDQIQDSTSFFVTSNCRWNVFVATNTTMSTRLLHLLLDDAARVLLYRENFNCAIY